MYFINVTIHIMQYIYIDTFIQKKIIFDKNLKNNDLNMGTNLKYYQIVHYL